MKSCSSLVKNISDRETNFLQNKCNTCYKYRNVLPNHKTCIYIFIYIFITVFPLSCTDGRYFYHISVTVLFSGTNYDFFGAIVMFFFISGTPSPNQENNFKSG